MPGLCKFSSILYIYVHVCSVVSISLQPPGLLPARLLCPWDSPGKNTKVDSHSFSKGSSWLRDRTCISCIGRQILYYCALGSPLYLYQNWYSHLTFSRVFPRWILSPFARWRHQTWQSLRVTWSVSARARIQTQLYVVLRHLAFLCSGSYFINVHQVRSLWS